MCEGYKNGQMMAYEEMCPAHRGIFYGNKLENSLDGLVGSGSDFTYTGGGNY